MNEQCPILGLRGLLILKCFFMIFFYSDADFEISINSINHISQNNQYMGIFSYGMILECTNLQA